MYIMVRFPSLKFVGPAHKAENYFPLKGEFLPLRIPLQDQKAKGVIHLFIFLRVAEKMDVSPLLLSSSNAANL